MQTRYFGAKMNSPAQQSLADLKSQIAMFHPDESREIYELVAKLNQVISHYQASAKLAMMIVCLETSVQEGQ
jgi:hypothetical protein